MICSFNLSIYIYIYIMAKTRKIGKRRKRTMRGGTIEWNGAGDEPLNVGTPRVQQWYPATGWRPGGVEVIPPVNQLQADYYNNILPSLCGFPNAEFMWWYLHGEVVAGGVGGPFAAFGGATAVAPAIIAAGAAGRAAAHAAGAFVAARAGGAAGGSVRCCPITRDGYPWITSARGMSWSLEWMLNSIWAAALPPVPADPAIIAAVPDVAAALPQRIVTVLAAVAGPAAANFDQHAAAAEVGRDGFQWGGSAVQRTHAERRFVGIPTEAQTVRGPSGQRDRILRRAAAEARVEHQRALGEPAGYAVWAAGTTPTAAAAAAAPEEVVQALALLHAAVPPPATLNYPDLVAVAVGDVGVMVAARHTSTLLFKINQFNRRRKPGQRICEQHQFTEHQGDLTRVVLQACPRVGFMSHSIHRHGPSADAEPRRVGESVRRYRERSTPAKARHQLLRDQGAPGAAAVLDNNDGHWRHIGATAQHERDLDAVQGCARAVQLEWRHRMLGAAERRGAAAAGAPPLVFGDAPARAAAAAAAPAPDAARGHSAPARLDDGGGDDGGGDDGGGDSGWKRAMLAGLASPPFSAVPRLRATAKSWTPKRSKEAESGGYKKRRRTRKKRRRRKRKTRRRKRKTRRRQRTRRRRRRTRRR
jgi:hypothetical protein